MTTASHADQPTPYPVQFSIEYPDRELGRLSTAFRLFLLIPIAVVLGAIAGFSGEAGSGGQAFAAGAGLLVLPPLLMIVFRQKYPRWWFDFNVQLLRFSNRVGAYVALMSDRYPSTDEEQYVRLDIAYPDARNGLSRWLPLVKWFLAIPHFVALFFLHVGAVFALVAAWFAILFTGRYPRRIFRYVEGVSRWQNRVIAYAVILATDEYPPFRLSA